MRACIFTELLRYEWLPRRVCICVAKYHDASHQSGNRRYGARHMYFIKAHLDEGGFRHRTLRLPNLPAAIL